LKQRKIQNGVAIQSAKVDLDYVDAGVVDVKKYM